MQELPISQEDDLHQPYFAHRRLREGGIFRRLFHLNFAVVPGFDR